MILLLLFHILALVATGFGIFYDFKHIQFPETDFQWHHRLGGKFKFISIQNMFIQFVYFLTAAINDVKGDPSCPEEVNTLQTFKNNYFCGLAFPLALFVTINFWVLHFTNREQFFPQPFQEVVPIWHLHMLHTNVTVLMLMEMFFSFRKYPEFCTGLITIISYMLTYILWLHIIRYFAGFWVYPYLNDKKSKELYSYFGSILLQGVIIYMLGEILNNAIWQFELVHRECQLKCPN